MPWALARGFFIPDNKLPAPFSFLACSWKQHHNLALEQQNLYHLSSYKSC